ncbi:GlxA family transcriptional regulator [Prosthecomicrobium hirschii]|uniref:GlxA family transcriptional regulator n=1 Tax=Prosthecodimorpha hirschii TaxID=665126 RepID=UPI00221EA95E|nr:helix-turn-helix domain-containing protein [Prosthecomicrobium hirschii]
MPPQTAVPLRASAPLRASVPFTLGILLVPGFSVLGLAALIEPLRLANHVADRALFAWRTLSPDGAPVVASSGFAVGVDGTGDPDAAFDGLVLCAGGEVEAPDGPYTELIAASARRGALVAGIDGGAEGLAAAGHLADRPVPVHWRRREHFALCRPDLAASDGLFDLSDTRASSAGGMAVVDLALALIQRQAGRDIAVSVCDELLHQRPRAAGEPQRPGAAAPVPQHDPRIAQVIAMMRTAIGAPRPIHAFAADVGLSSRQLERLFLRDLGCSPGAVFLDMRLDRARDLLAGTDQPIASVARDCGFVSQSHFSKAFRDRFGLSPGEARQPVRPPRPSWRAPAVSIGTAASTADA